MSRNSVRVICMQQTLPPLYLRPFFLSQHTRTIAATVGSLTHQHHSSLRTTHDFTRRTRTTERPPPPSAYQPPPAHAHPVRPRPSCGLHTLFCAQRNPTMPASASVCAQSACFLFSLSVVSHLVSTHGRWRKKSFRWAKLVQLTFY